MVETDDGTKEIEITAGVAQGSVGGPTIWNIHYDALLRLILPKDVVLVGYADDVAMVAVAAAIEELEWKCNETLNSQSMDERARLQISPGEERGCTRNKEKKVRVPRTCTRWPYDTVPAQHPVPGLMDRQVLEI